VAAVWIGFDEPQSLGIPSSVGALPIWRRFIEELTGGVVPGAFLRPPEVEVLEIEPSTGSLALAGCPERRREFFLRGTAPTDVCPIGHIAGAAPGEPTNSGGLFRWLRR
jgi:membrane carboxypeptidase/penicillin-binding protein